LKEKDKNIRRKFSLLNKHAQFIFNLINICPDKMGNLMQMNTHILDNPLQISVYIELNTERWCKAVRLQRPGVFFTFSGCCYRDQRGMKPHTKSIWHAKQTQ